MKVASLRTQVAELVAELAQYHGYRTIWVAGDHTLYHTEPDVELEGEGFTYVATLMRPTYETLFHNLVRSTPEPQFESDEMDAWILPSGSDWALAESLA